VFVEENIYYNIIPIAFSAGIPENASRNGL
jgi:hypothetical protein